VKFLTSKQHVNDCLLFISLVCVLCVSDARPTVILIVLIGAIDVF